MNLKEGILSLKYLKLALLFIVMGCNSTLDLVLDDQGSGKANLNFIIPDYLLQQVDALQQNLPPNTPDFLSPEFIKKQLASNKSLKDIEVTATQRGRLAIKWSFDDLNAMLENTQLKEGQRHFLRSLLRLMPLANGSERLEFRLNRENYNKLLVNNPMLGENPLLQYYGPSITEDIPLQDYRDLIAYAFGEFAEKKLDTSEFIVSIELPRVLKKVEGGRQMSDKKVVFKLKLLDVLYFKVPEVYAIEY